MPPDDPGGLPNGLGNEESPVREKEGIMTTAFLGGKRVTTSPWMNRMCRSRNVAVNSRKNKRDG